MGQIMGIIINVLSQAQRDPLENLRLAVERAEAAGVEEDTLEDVRTKLAELENEVGKELSISIRHAVSGETLTVVRARPSHTPSYLREHVLRATGDGRQNEGEGGVALHFLFQSQVLDERVSLRDAGLCDGDTVFLVQTPLLCLTASFDGTARIWYLQNGDCRKMLVARQGGQAGHEKEGNTVTVLREHLPL
eukprot:symbB.v1.2.001562.t1/scaffold70.1/size352959/12